jgi:hypothetical protein
MSTRSGLIGLALLAIFACVVLPCTLARPLQIGRSRGVVEAQQSGQESPSLGDDNRIPGVDVPPWARDKQRRDLLHANLAKSKKDSAELATLAHQLQEELEKPDASPLSPQCAVRLARIEKLAKKIRDELKVY